MPAPLTKRNSSSNDNSKNNSGASSSSAELPMKQTPPAKPATKRKQLFKRLIPKALMKHGRTVYGGNPLVQQTLPGIFSYPSPFMMIPIFFLLMIPFVVVGALFIVESSKRYLVHQEYSQIHQYQYVPSDPAVNINQGIRSFVADGVTHRQGTVTWMAFNITKHMKAPVYFYYTLGNMYQNYRDFHNGRSIPQLRGVDNIGSTFLCKPFNYPGFLNEKDEPVTIATPSGPTTRMTSAFTYNPCGLAAWSMFNDTLALYKVVQPTDSAAGSDGLVMGGADGTTPLRLVCDGAGFDVHGNPLHQSAGVNHCHKKGISWKADVELRFKPIKPREDWWSLRYPYNTSNEYLNKGWYLHEPGHSLPDPVDLDLQVWMRSAVLSDFRKLYRVIEEDLSPGEYVLRVNEFFDTVSFDGRKGFTLRTEKWIGDSNVVIGVVYIIIGCLCFVLGVAFLTEYVLSRNEVRRLDRLPEPKRSWYLFDPRSPQFKEYYQLRTERYVPMEELEALRAVQDGDGNSDS